MLLSKVTEHKEIWTGFFSLSIQMLYHTYMHKCTDAHTQRQLATFLSIAKKALTLTLHIIKIKLIHQSVLDNNIDGYITLTKKSVFEAYLT